MPNPNRYAGLTGRALTKQVREDIARAGVTMSVHASYDHLPNEHRARVRAEQTALVRQYRDEAQKALAAWADEEVREAQKVLFSDPVQSAAAESRRVADEMKIARLVDSARAEDARRGAVIPNGLSRPVTNGSAYALAERATEAYLAGDLDNAGLYAQASVELGGPETGAEILQSVVLDRQLADPAKARAHRDIADVEVVAMAFERDVNATFAQSLQDSRKLAEALGDGPGASKLAPEIANASMNAKMAAAIGAERFGGTYEEPAGVLPGLPRNEDPRGVPQPDGARMPDRR